MAEDYNCNIRRYVDNAPPPEPHDVRAHLHGGVPVRVQERIANVLSCIDTAIEKTEALIAKHQQIKAGLMHDLFTRGVLPNGQLRPPRSEAPELYQETEIGWIPRGWRVEQAGTLCSLITKGTTPAAHEMWQEGEGSWPTRPR